MRRMLILAVLLTGCAAPQPAPKPTVDQKKLELAADILVSMYSQRDGIRGHDPVADVAAAKAAAAEFYAQSSAKETQ